MSNNINNSANYETALSVASSIYEKSCYLFIDGKRIQVKGIKLEEAQPLLDKYNVESGYLREIIQGPLKNWAQDHREIIISFDMDEDGDISFIQGVFLHQRQTLGSGFWCNPSNSNSIPYFLKNLNSNINHIITDALSNEQRAALGHFLSKYNLSKTVSIIEIPNTLGNDYKDLLAGSFWVNLDRDKKRSLAGQCILTALKVRSIRKTALPDQKISDYEPYVAYMLNKRGWEITRISTELKTSNQHVEKMIRFIANKFLSNKNKSSLDNLPDPKQIAFAKHLFSKAPYIRDLLPQGWENQHDQTFKVLGGINNFIKQNENIIFGLKARIIFRHELGRGFPISVIMKKVDLPNDCIKRYLEEDLNERLKLIVNSFEKHTSVKITEECLIRSIASNNQG